MPLWRKFWPVGDVACFAAERNLRVASFWFRGAPAGRTSRKPRARPSARVGDASFFKARAPRFLYFAPNRPRADPRPHDRAPIATRAVVDRPWRKRNRRLAPILEPPWAMKHGRRPSSGGEAVAIPRRRYADGDDGARVGASAPAVRDDRGRRVERKEGVSYGRLQRHLLTSRDPIPGRGDLALNRDVRARPDIF